MADPKPVSYKYYQHDGIIEPVAATNQLPYSEVSYNDFLNYAKSTQARDAAINNAPVGQSVFDYYSSNANYKGVFDNGGASSGYIVNPETQQQQLATSYQAEQDRANDPNMMNIGTVSAPMYVPKGSAGAANVPNLGTQNTSIAANAGLPAVQGGSSSTSGVDPVLAAFNQQQIGALPGREIASSSIQTPGTPQVYRDANNNFYTVDAAGNRIHMSLEEFKRLGINETFVPAGSTVSLQQATTGRSGASPLPSGVVNLTPDTIGSVSAFNISNPTQSNEPGAIVAGADAIVQQYMQQAATAQSEADAEADKLTNEISSLLEGTTGQAVAQMSAEEANQVAAIKKQVADVSAQLASKIAEYNALSAQNEGRPVTMNSIIGSEAQIQRMKASEIGMLQAHLFGLQGQAAAAQEAADRSVELKYKDIEQQIKVKQAQLELLQPTLKKEEKARAEALNRYYDQQKQLVAEQKAADKSFQAAKISALTRKGGITANEAAQAEQLFNAGRVNEAFSLLKDRSVASSNDSSSTTKQGAPLSILDVQRYNDTYPDAGVTAGDTEDEANMKIKISTQKGFIDEALGSGESLDSIMADLNSFNIPADAKQELLDYAASQQSSKAESPWWGDLLRYNTMGLK